jgi:hypothetical protein
MTLKARLIKPGRPTIASGYRKALEQLLNYQTTLYIVTSLSITVSSSQLPLTLLTLQFGARFLQPCSCRSLHFCIRIASLASYHPSILAPEEPAKRGTGTKRIQLSNAYAINTSPSPRTAPIANTTQPTRKGSEASKPHLQCQLYHYLTMQPRRNCPPSPFAASSRISPPYYRGTASSPDGLPHLQTLSAKPLLSRRAQLSA